MNLVTKQLSKGAFFASLAWAPLSQAECVAPENILQSQVFAYSQEDGFVLDGFSGEADEGLLTFHGWVQTDVSEPDQIVHAFILIHEDNVGPNKPPLGEYSSWRLETLDSTDFGGFSFYGASNVDLLPEEIAPGGTARYQTFLLWNGCDGTEIEPVHPYLSPDGPAVAQYTNNGTNPTILIGENIFSGVVADASPRPSDSGTHGYLGLGRSKFDPNPVDGNDQAETNRYYRSVAVNPTENVEQNLSRRNSCYSGAAQCSAACQGCQACQSIYAQCAAIKEGSVASELSTLKRFRDRYFPAGINQSHHQPGIGKEIVTEYYNQGDLGIGREMHCNFGIDGERACYVSNYAPCRANSLLSNGRCQAPIFGDVDGSVQQQTSGGVPFATVAMVERDVLRGQPNQTYFAVYACTGQNCNDLAQHSLFSGPVALDNHGVDAALNPNSPPQSNTFNPGNCMSCHGGGGSYSPATATNRLNAYTVGAAFLPFDMEVFSYFPGHSRADNMAPMREMNERIATEGMIKDIGTASDMIATWYGGLNSQNDFINQNFSSFGIPASFSNNPSDLDGRIYRDIYAVGCRGCHITQENNQLATKATWSAFGPGLVKTLVCDTHGMPLAEQTQDVVWEGSFRQHLMMSFGITDAECSP